VSKYSRDFIEDSYATHTSKLLQQPLLQMLLNFSKDEKDNINPETIEFLEPYLSLETEDEVPVLLFDPDLASKTSAALKGLTTWAKAMSDYHKASKIVNPKLRLVEQKKNALEKAQAELDDAKEELR